MKGGGREYLGEAGCSVDLLFSNLETSGVGEKHI